ncbi:hypothetical protein [Paraflavitalea pollutisoli]|uniref:hypothetical protein n=1 Tax=Paraflavitalea pollutisoli TaxID=3034143 RepID=UPI0023EDB059|nr:hypothetical protein [Paraflavitalea sp. H1-2-19X]
MKQIIIASMTLLFATTAANAQNAGDITAVKHETVVKEKKATAPKKAAREERRELRKLEAGQVSYFSQQQFAQDFGNVPNVSWKRTAYFDEATFQQDGHTQTAYYDIESKLVGTTEVKAVTELPEAGQKAIAKQYKGYTVQNVILFDDNESNDSDMLLYGVQFDDADNYFVELTKGSQDIIVQIDLTGNLFYFANLRK